MGRHFHQCNNTIIIIIIIIIVEYPWWTVPLSNSVTVWCYIITPQRHSAVIWEIQLILQRQTVQLTKTDQLVKVRRSETDVLPLSHVPNQLVSG